MAGPVHDDLTLLRSFEPVLRFTEGEYFYPVSAERFVARAAQWNDTGDGDPVREAEPGTLTLASLAERSAAHQGLGRSLSGVVTGAKDPGFRISAYRRPPRLRGGSRLAAVGLLARAIDALNRVSLLFRGSVPGGSAARAFALQQDHLAPDEPTYYGRVIRDGHWIICQYWFFYTFNNWRSAFGGVNEHEGDWEQVTVYLDGTGEVDDDGLPHARWVVFSAHDEEGDDLRRRWDDPDLTVLDGRHPVVFSGAGSHSGVYLPGDYLITIPTPTLGGLVRVLRFIGRVIAPWAGRDPGGLGLPYVDYARGDGRVIGPGGDAWHAVVIDEDTPWVRDFRGLWGHDTRDRLGGERGPAGPRYERDGTVRESWGDPVGWAGLAKVAPNPTEAARLLAQRSDEIVARLASVDKKVADERRRLQTAAAGLTPGSPEVRGLGDDERRLLDLRMESTRLRDELARLRGLPRSGPSSVGPHDHLAHRRLPLSPAKGVRSRLLAGWAVVSTPVILLAIASVISPAAGLSVLTIAGIWLAFLLIVEGTVRARLLAILMRIALVVGVVFAVRHLTIDWRVVVAGALYGAGLALLAVNLRDAFRR